MHGMIYVFALCLAAGGACRKEAVWDAREVDVALVRLDTAHMRLRHDTVGHGKWASEASFVLVDVENTHTQDLRIHLHR